MGRTHASGRPRVDRSGLRDACGCHRATASTMPRRWGGRAATRKAVRTPAASMPCRLDVWVRMRSARHPAMAWSAAARHGLTRRAPRHPRWRSGFPTSARRPNRGCMVHSRRTVGPVRAHASFGVTDGVAVDCRRSGSVVREGRRGKAGRVEACTAWPRSSDNCGRSGHPPCRRRAGHRRSSPARAGTRGPCSP